jgi:type III pantothenate kinase
MRADVVVDVGNTRIKWGRCGAARIADFVSLPPTESQTWQKQLQDWGLAGKKVVWAVSGVRPGTLSTLVDWLTDSGQTVHQIMSPQQLRLEVALEKPTQVGIDRLLNAVAANDRVQRQVAKIVIDAGTAVTVDLVDEDGRFCGGAIFPGFRLMAEALHGHTGLLPFVEMRSQNPLVPGHSTVQAIEAGIYWGVAGGIKALIRQMTAGKALPHERVVFLTGGSASALKPVMDLDVILWPEMTLEGIRLSAEAQT